MTGLPSTRPLAPAVPTRVKKHGNQRTTQRIDNMKRLVEELSRRLMTPTDIGQFLEFSPSGVRKYLADLREACIVEAQTTDFQTDQLNYGLIEDKTMVDAYLASLDTIRIGAPSRRMKSNVDLALRDKSRSFHLLRDDAYYSVRVSKAQVAPDPLALHRDFFKASDASLPATVRGEPVVPAAPTGFAALDVQFVRKVSVPQPARKTRPRSEPQPDYAGVGHAMAAMAARWHGGAA